MNSPLPLLRRLLLRRSPNPKRSYSATPSPLAMEPGLPVPGLEAIFPKAKDPSKSRTPVVLRREEYPPWVSELAKPLPTLAKLRAMPFEEATDRDMRRYLKLTRKAKIKRQNAESAKK